MNTHFPASAIPLLPPMYVRLQNRNLARLRHQSESSRHGLSILMVTESYGNIETYKSFSDSNMKKKYYTPIQHNLLFDGYYCTEDLRYAMYHYSVGNLRVPYHYFISMFKLIQLYTLHAPHHLITTDTSMFTNCSQPVIRPQFIHGPPRNYVPKHRPYRLQYPPYNWT